jgi:hypothetical protein
MRIRSLLSLVAFCGAVCACATQPTDTADTAASSSAPVYRTGSRLPSNESSATGQMSRDDYMIQRTREGSPGGRMQ